MNIYFSSLALPVWDRQCLEYIWSKGSLTQLMDRGDWRTALATLGLLKILNVSCHNSSKNLLNIGLPVERSNYFLRAPKSYILTQFLTTKNTNVSAWHAIKFLESVGSTMGKKLTHLYLRPTLYNTSILWWFETDLDNNCNYLVCSTYLSWSPLLLSVLGRCIIICFWLLLLAVGGTGFNWLGSGE